MFDRPFVIVILLIGLGVFAVAVALLAIGARENDQSSASVVTPVSSSRSGSRSIESVARALEDDLIPNSSCGMTPNSNAFALQKSVFDTTFNTWVTQNAVYYDNSYTELRVNPEQVPVNAIPVVQNIYSFPFTNPGNYYPETSRGVFCKKTENVVSDHTVFDSVQDYAANTGTTANSTTLNAGYVYMDQYKGDFTKSTQFLKGTVLLPFRGQGIGYLAISGDNHKGRGAMVTAKDGGYYISQPFGVGTQLITKGKTALTPNVNPSATFWSFLAIEWSVQSKDKPTMRIEGRYVSKNLSSEPYTVQKVSNTESSVEGYDQPIGFSVYVPNQNDGSTLWGGTVAFQNQTLTDTQLATYAQRWSGYFDPSAQPIIYSAEPNQTFWVQQSALARNYTAPSVRYSGNQADNEFVLVPPLPEGLGLSLNSVGQIQGIAKTTYQGEHGLRLQNKVTFESSPLYPISITVNPAIYITYSPNPATFFAGSGGSVPAPKLNGFTGVTTSTTPAAGFTFNADGSITVATTVSAGTTQVFSVDGVPETGVPLLTVSETINVVAAPDVVLGMTLRYIDKIAVSYTGSFQSIRPQLDVTGYPATSTPVVTFAITQRARRLSVQRNNWCDHAEQQH